jgi:hypothetical protein
LLIEMTRQSCRLKQSTFVKTKLWSDSQNS